jgi:hypothetical protein
MYIYGATQGRPSFTCSVKPGAEFGREAARQSLVDDQAVGLIVLSASGPI